MNKLTFDQISEIINSDLFSKNQCGGRYWMHTEIYENAEEVENEDLKVEFLKLGNFEEVTHLHSSECEVGSYYSVYHFIDHDIYIQFDGWWVSHEGADYNEMFEVRPEQVTITQYQRV